MLNGSIVSLSQLEKKPPTRENRVSSHEDDQADDGGLVAQEAADDDRRLRDDDVVVLDLGLAGDGGRVDGVEVCHGYCTRTLGSTRVVAKSARIAPIAKITEP